MRETLWQRLFHGVRHVWQRPDWSEFVGADWAEHVMDLAVTDRSHAKQGRSTGRWVTQRDGRQVAVYLKRHYRLAWWRGWLAAAWPNAGWSPAVQEWRHLRWALDQGMPVPEAVAAGEYIGPWGRLQSFLAVKELTGMLPLHEAIPLAAQRLSVLVFRQWKRGLVRELARLTRGLHGRMHFHKDLYLCHFYVPEALTGFLPLWPGRVHMIDLHRLRHHPWTWRVWQSKDLAQLLYSSEITGVDVRDRVYFWRAYLGRQGRRWPARLLRHLVRLRWRRYRRHNEKRLDGAVRPARA
jgi:heptose I phosphotransferase